jgi:hypothetical protein
MLTLNGVIQTIGGNLTFSGASINANAAIYGPHAPIFSPDPIRGPGYVYDIHPPIDTSSSDADKSAASHSAETINNLLIKPQAPGDAYSSSANASSSTATPAQTAGGGDGEFGGSKDDGKGGKDDKSKPLPMCT